MAQSYAHAPAVGRPDGGTRGAAPKGITMEQVNALADENRRLRQMVSQMDAANLFRRLDFLFRVVASPEAFGPAFVARCASEIEAALTIAERPAEAAPDGAEVKEGGD